MAAMVSLMFTRSLSYERVVRAAHFDERYHLGIGKMLSGGCDIRHENNESDRQTRAARIHCENLAISSNCPVQMEFNLNPVKRTFDEELLALNERKIPASQSCSPASIMCPIVALSLFSSALHAQNAAQAGRFHVENL